MLLFVTVKGRWLLYLTLNTELSLSALVGLTSLYICNWLVILVFNLLCVGL